MSDTSLNEIQPKIMKLDTPDQDTAAALKKPDSIFVVPGSQSSSPNLTTVTISDSRKSSPQNKVHVIPFNLGSQKTTPIKLIKDLRPASQANIGSSITNKKFIQVSAFSANLNTSSNIATSPIRANNLFINNSDKSPQNNTKILTISNGLNSNSNLSNSNKIQYVKIVNTPSLSSNSTPIKLTTITSTNGNTNNSQEAFSIRPVVSSIAPSAIKTIPKPASSPIASQTSTVSLKQSDQPGSSVLLNAMNNSPNLHDAPSVSNKTPATTTIQLVNQSQRSQLINQKTSIIQRIQSFPPNQSAVKTVASTSNESQSGQADRNACYKVLNQQFQNSSNKSDGSNISEVKSGINSENLNLLSNSVNQNSSSVQSKSPEIESLKISTSKPKAAHQQTSPINLNQSSSSASTRKPCNCTKSMCLKLYCDCFAQGSFCHDCNCVNCFNTLDHEEERNKAIKMVLERNPQAFQSKIGKFTASLAITKAATPQVSQTPTITSGIEDLITASATTDELDEIKSRHVKGCNCKKSNCLKRYCECFLAKIQCSALCKCVGCKNCDESTRTLLQLANAADLRKQQQQQEQKQQFIQQQQQNKQLFSPKNTQSGSNSSTKTSTNFKVKNLEILNENKQFLVEKQKLISRAYNSVMDTSVLKETCESLMSRLVSEIESEKMLTDDDEHKSLSESMEIDMEKCLIEHFGNFLATVIQNAETKSTSN